MTHSLSAQNTPQVLYFPDAEPYYKHVNQQDTNENSPHKGNLSAPESVLTIRGGASGGTSGGGKYTSNYNKDYYETKNPTAHPLELKLAAHTGVISAESERPLIESFHRISYPKWNQELTSHPLKETTRFNHEVNTLDSAKQNVSSANNLSEQIFTSAIAAENGTAYGSGISYFATATTAYSHPNGGTIWEQQLSGTYSNPAGTTLTIPGYHTVSSNSSTLAGEGEKILGDVHGPGTLINQSSGTTTITSYVNAPLVFSGSGQTNLNGQINSPNILVDGDGELFFNGTIGGATTISQTGTGTTHVTGSINNAVNISISNGIFSLERQDTSYRLQNVTVSDKGRLILANNYQLGNNRYWVGSLTLNDGAVLEMQGTNQFFENLTITGNVYIDMGTDSVSTVTLSNLYFTEGATLTLVGYKPSTGDIFPLTQIKAGDIDRIHYSDKMPQIPEPSTYGLLAGVAFLALAVRKKIRG